MSQLSDESGRGPTVRLPMNFGDMVWRRGTGAAGIVSAFQFFGNDSKVRVEWADKQEYHYLFELLTEQPPTPEKSE